VITDLIVVRVERFSTEALKSKCKANLWNTENCGADGILRNGHF